MAQQLVKTTLLLVALVVVSAVELCRAIEFDERDLASDEVL